MSPSTQNLEGALSALVDLKDAYREHLGAVWNCADAGGFNPSNVDCDDEDGDEEVEDEVGRTYTAVEAAYQSAFLAVTALTQEVAILKAAAAGDESISIRRPDDGSNPIVSTGDVYVAVVARRDENVAIEVHANQDAAEAALYRMIRSAWSSAEIVEMMPHSGPDTMVNELIPADLVELINDECHEAVVRREVVR